MTTEELQILKDTNEYAEWLDQQIDRRIADEKLDEAYDLWLEEVNPTIEEHDLATLDK